jgi:energy-coupling factor transporter transmembrane protein EcfT
MATAGGHRERRENIMKWIKNFCLEILSKVKSHIAAVIATTIIGAFILIISFVFKTYLKNVYTFTFPLWGWLAIITVFAGVPLILFLIINWLRNSKSPPATSIEKRLTDPGAITDKLIWWLGQQRGFVCIQTEFKQPVVWHFSVIDEKNKLSPGSAKKYLPEILNSSESPFPARVKNVSSDTIRLEYDFSPYSPNAGRFPRT